VISGSMPPLSEIWELAQGNLRRLPEEYRQIVNAREYPVRFSEGICRMRDRALAAQREGVSVSEADL
jgi:Nicotinate phosphoribosyltransferase C-terminal domain